MFIIGSTGCLYLFFIAMLLPFISSGVVNKTNGNIDYSWFNDNANGVLSSNNKDIYSNINDNLKLSSFRSNYVKDITNEHDNDNNNGVNGNDMSFSYYYVSENREIKAWFHNFSEDNFEYYTDTLKNANADIEDKKADSGILTFVLSNLLKPLYTLFNDWKIGWKFICSFFYDLVFN
ncbi:hypothetical protein RS030_243598 [Cryptosporidium xiaoi]|uniref:Uncharacterized protein n=1 Tax=Cryptosporidium xiaoi TaxID=659607 RepID=A0AAV9XWG3_9CRYT